MLLKVSESLFSTEWFVGVGEARSPFPAAVTSAAAPGAAEASAEASSSNWSTSVPAAAASAAYSRPGQSP